MKLGDPHGVRKITATLAQNGVSYQVWQTTATVRGADTTQTFDVGAKTTPQLSDGPARLIIEATLRSMLLRFFPVRSVASWPQCLCQRSRPSRKVTLADKNEAAGLGA